MGVFKIYLEPAWPNGGGVGGGGGVFKIDEQVASPNESPNEGAC